MAIRTRLAALLSGLLIAACGGGGGELSVVSGGDGGATTTEVTITADNMEPVAGISVSLARADLASASEAGDAVTGSVLDDGSRVSVAEAGALAIRSAIRLLSGAPAEDLVQGVTLTRSEDCNVGGEVLISIDSGDDDLLTLDPGDRVALDFADCTQDGETVDGKLELTVTRLSGRLDDSGSATLAATFTALRFSDGSDSLTADGSMTIEVTVSNGAVSATADSQDIEYRLAADGDVVVITVREGSVSFTENAITGTTVTVTEDYVVVSTDVRGVLRIVTETALDIGSGQQILSGRLRVNGLASVLWLTFLTAGEVLIELDDDDDGLIDVSRVTSLALLPFALP
ncbi:MAG: hypothetical protein KDG52_05465 [Rhodocyclaceae bacterium]|nr:hypothetical protein [Rhodocyclaceae bacterium]